MTFLQRELDFSSFGTTGEQLAEYWAPVDRTPRSHRRRPRFTRVQLLAAAFGIAGVALLSGAPQSAVESAPATHLAAPIPPPDTDPGPVAVTDTTEVVELRGGDRPASRTGYRISVRNVQKKVVESTTRWVSPVARVRVTSCFGPRWGRQHEGIDLDGETGDTIRSVGAGVVVQAGWRYSGLGNSVIVDHGKWLTIYAHASRVLVKVNQQVRAGAKIALIGATGNVTGTHLHLALSNGATLSRALSTLVNPAPWLRARGVRLGTCT